MNPEIVYFAKLRDDAVLPTKRDEDAGFDLYPVLDGTDIIIHPGETVGIHTGIASAFSADKVAVIKERSSTGSRGLQQRCGVIDSGYRGEWIIPVTNGGQKPMVISNSPQIYLNSMWDTFSADKAIAQVLFFDLPRVKSKQIPMDELLSMKSERGTGGFGSTGK